MEIHNQLSDHFTLRFAITLETYLRTFASVILYSHIIFLLIHTA